MRDLLKSIGLSEDLLACDRNDLDNEFERHPQAIADIADAVADARKGVELAKAELDKVEHRVRLEKLEQADAQGRKVTVKDVDALVQADPEVRRQARAVIVSEHAAKRWDGLLAAAQAKTSALKHLSELYQAGYYTTNRSSQPRRSRRDD